MRDKPVLCKLMIILQSLIERQCPSATLIMVLLEVHDIFCNWLWILSLQSLSHCVCPGNSQVICAQHYHSTSTNASITDAPTSSSSQAVNNMNQLMSSIEHWPQWGTVTVVSREEWSVTGVIHWLASWQVPSIWRRPWWPMSKVATLFQKLSR